MKAKRKIVASMIAVFLLLVSVMTPAGLIKAEAKTKTRNVTVGGIVLKIPTVYEPIKDLDFNGYKLYMKSNSSSDLSSGKIQYLCTMTMDMSKEEMDFSDADIDYMASVIQGSANSQTKKEGKIKNLKKKKIAGYQGLIFDYNVPTDKGSVRERALVIANKDSEKIVMVAAVESNGNGNSLKVINTIAKTAKKKK